MYLLTVYSCKQLGNFSDKILWRFVYSTNHKSTKMSREMINRPRQLFGLSCQTQISLPSPIDAKSQSSKSQSTNSLNLRFLWTWRRWLRIFPLKLIPSGTCSVKFRGSAMVGLLCLIIWPCQGLSFIDWAQYTSHIFGRHNYKRIHLSYDLIFCYAMKENSWCIQH